MINEVIDYDKEDYRLYFLNKIISNLNQYLLHVYHGASKRMLPLYYCKYEWRFNHRKCRSIMEKIKNYITLSRIAIRKMIRESVDQYAMARGLEISQGLSDGYSHFNMCFFCWWIIKKEQIINSFQFQVLDDLKFALSNQNDK